MHSFKKVIIMLLCKDIFVDKMKQINFTDHTISVFYPQPVVGQGSYFNWFQHAAPRLVVHAIKLSKRIAGRKCLPVKHRSSPVMLSHARCFRALIWTRGVPLLFYFSFFYSINALFIRFYFLAHQFLAE